MIICFTGHRPQKIGGFKPCATHDWLRARVREMLLELKPIEAISGMALGFDQIAVDYVPSPSFIESSSSGPSSYEPGPSTDTAPTSSDSSWGGGGGEGGGGGASGDY